MDHYIKILNKEIEITPEFQDLFDTPTYYAAETANLELLNYLYENNFTFDGYTFAHAIAENNQEIISWLKDHNCPLNNQTFITAVDSGNLELIYWLKDNNCPWSDCTYLPILNKLK